jgi:hypothetical protein
METIFSASDLVSAVFDNIASGDLKNAQTVTRSWRNIVCGINAPNPRDDPNRGEKMYTHSKVLDLKNGSLLIETDHPGWTQLFHIHRKYILSQLKKAAPELNITSLSFKLKKGLD